MRCVTDSEIKKEEDENTSHSTYMQIECPLFIWNDIWICSHWFKNRVYIIRQTRCVHSPWTNKNIYIFVAIQNQLWVEVSTLWDNTSQKLIQICLCLSLLAVDLKLMLNFTKEKLSRENELNIRCLMVRWFDRTRDLHSPVIFFEQTKRYHIVEER